MALTTTGQVDWVSLTSNTITGSTAILQRLSMANVDPYTLVVAQAVSSHFKMSLLGQRRVHEAVQNLKCLSSIGDAVWFGIGVKHIIRTLAETKEGTMCLTMCASLAEVFGSEVSAVILGELASVLGLPEGSGPSLPQWQHLVVSCAGTLAATSFPCVVEHFMGLYEVRDRSRKGFESRSMSDFNDVAQALGGVVETLNGSVTSITLVGGAACGWIAAFAHWFLGLTIEIRGGDYEDEILYTSSLDGKVAISVIYDNSGHDMAIQRRDTTYVLRELDSAMSAVYSNANHLSGRVPWDGALTTAFGSQARILIETQELGMMLGAAASIFVAISKADPNVSLYDRCAKWPGYGEMGVGFGFLRSAWNWVPELQGVSDAAEAYVGEPVLFAYRTFNNALNALSQMCACYSCGRCRGETDKTVPRVDTCLPALGTVVVQLIWSLASMHLETPLQPSLKGLHRIANCQSYWLRREFVTNSWGGQPFKDSGKLTDLFSTQSVQWTAATVLGGGLAFTRDDARSAFTIEGICFYQGILRELTDRPEAVAVLHVLPGCIQMRAGRIVTALEDVPVQKSSQSTTPFSLDNTQPYNPSNAGDNTGSNLSVDLMIKEAVTRAFIYFRLTSECGKRYDIGPALHMSNVLAAAGSVQCNTERHEESFTLPADGVISLDGEMALERRTFKSKGMLIIVRRLSRNTLARCVALSDCSFYPGERDQRTILRTHECLNCCLREALFRAACVRDAQDARDTLIRAARKVYRPVLIIA